MAFASFHYEKAFEDKAMEYIMNAGTSLNVVEKKWGRISPKTQDWAWTNVEEALSKKDGLNEEQQARLEEVKAKVGK
ncbi:MAG: hypothetical protein GKC03_06575 [Methanomassiliicoccales archaeon]|nr:hypothetical protein [Methanomassiliicoccales archaeon]NYT15944.1 hypothetical protein [Methanomassiliicoccales archaeon]